MYFHFEGEVISEGGGGGGGDADIAAIMQIKLVCCCRIGSGETVVVKYVSILMKV